MEFKPELVRYTIDKIVTRNQYGLAALYKDGDTEFSVAVAIEPFTTWNRITTEFLPMMIREIQTKVEAKEVA